MTAVQLLDELIHAEQHAGGGGLRPFLIQTGQEWGGMVGSRGGTSGLADVAL